jgi:GT2 family glycosyltransferase
MACARAPRVVGNDWQVLAPPPVGGWRPTLPVSVVIPAYNCQDCLTVALAALSHQSYPSELLEVVVVDDGSDPKLELPELVPAHCRLVRAPDHSTGWGRANALHVGAGVADGEILHWLDADLVPFREHVEAQARWHHAAPDVVTLGYKRFVRDELADPAGVLPRVAAGAVADLFPPGATEPHGYIEDYIEVTDRLRTADHLVFRAHVGATAALRRDLYAASGGLDVRLRLGEDGEFGYRLAQAGAVFVPEPQARSWHLGPSHAMTVGERQRRYNWPFLADRMPLPPWLREGVRRSWAVPLVTAVVEVGDQPFEVVRGCVDRLLAGNDFDLRVLLVGQWDAGSDPGRPVLDDPVLEHRLIAETYRSEPRVVLAGTAPETAFPAPFLLRVPAWLGVGRGAVRRLVGTANSERLGLLRVAPPGAGAGPAEPAVELWRTAALSRARRHQAPGEPLAAAVAAVWGGQWRSGPDFGLVDLRTLPAEEQPWAPPVTGPVAGRPMPDGGPADRPAAAHPPVAVPVAGLRSLVRAAVFVARLALVRAAVVVARLVLVRAGRRRPRERRR